MTPDQQIDGLRAVFPDVQRVPIGGLVCAVIPKLKIQTVRGIVERRALLYPHPESNYTNRLFLDQVVDAPNAKNWQQRQLGAEAWWVCSWNDVPANVTWTQMLQDHLRAYR